ncbi:hypothetical protein [Kitasatospora camelliae]|uniref:HEAT repeat protein n=1 Tax=Kitasatospora camelliae TaxID=3156397 RepID=A0AAU8JNG6_9ACTN
MADVIHRLLLDEKDTAVIQATAEALLARKDTSGLRCVLLALSRAASTDAVDEIGAALDGNPEWMTTEGEDRLLRQLRDLAGDEDLGVRDEAERILAGLRSHEERLRVSSRPGP